MIEMGGDGGSYPVRFSCYDRPFYSYLFLLFVSCCFYGLVFFIRICVFAFQGKEEIPKKGSLYVTMDMLDSIIKF